MSGRYSAVEKPVACVWSRELHQGLSPSDELFVQKMSMSLFQIQRKCLTRPVLPICSAALKPIFDEKKLGWQISRRQARSMATLYTQRTKGLDLISAATTFQCFPLHIVMDLMQLAYIPIAK